jgi:hypothetical protein
VKEETSVQENLLTVLRRPSGDLEKVLKPSEKAKRTVDDKERKAAVDYELSDYEQSAWKNMMKKAVKKTVKEEVEQLDEGSEPTSKKEWARVGDRVTALAAGKNAMEGTVVHVKETGTIPLAKVEWSSGATGYHSITALRKLMKEEGEGGAVATNNVAATPGIAMPSPPKLFKKPIKRNAK